MKKSPNPHRLGFFFPERERWRGSVSLEQPPAEVALLRSNPLSCSHCFLLALRIPGSKIAHRRALAADQTAFSPAVDHASETAKGTKKVLRRRDSAG